MMGRARRIVVAGLAALLALGVQACREEEQGRILVHRKGEYQGERDQRLGREQLDALAARARQQQQY